MTDKKIKAVYDRFIQVSRHSTRYYFYNSNDGNWPIVLGRETSAKGRFRCVADGGASGRHGPLRVETGPCNTTLQLLFSHPMRPAKLVTGIG